jgi:4-aminobutyrate aminotransferase-like enzyme
LHDFGTTIGIEMDIESAELVAAAANCGLRLESAGEAAVRLQLPLVLSEEDRDRMLDRLRQSLEAIELATAEIGV